MGTLLQKAAAAAILAGLVQGGGASCKPPKNTDDPNQGVNQCQVVERANNSNGTAYLRIDCDGGDPSNGSVRSLMSDTEWPQCRVGAYWPGCKDA